MQSYERLTVTLPTEIVQTIRDKVKAGQYGSESDVVCEAVQSWQPHAELRAERLGQIRAKIAAARADPGPSFSDEDVGRRLQERYQQIVSAAARRD